jgi:serine O-acetyltransferase
MRRRFKYRHMFWTAVPGADIPLRTKIGGGLIIPYPNGMVIHADAVIGPNCLIFQQSTLGASRKPGTPKLGGHVRTCADIGANAVVLRDVPPDALAVGIPARIVLSEERTDCPDQDDAPPDADEGLG